MSAIEPQVKGVTLGQAFEITYTVLMFEGAF
jgi:hypothetical protein